MKNIECLTCFYYSPYCEGAYDSCLYGASEEDFQYTPPCLEGDDENV